MAKPEIPAKLSPDLKERLDKRFANFPLVQGWNLSIDDLVPGAARLNVGDSAKIHNTSGNVHGGVLSSVADMACAIALCTIFDGAMPFSTSDLHIRFLEPALGPFTAEAQILRLSPRSAILECHLRCKGRVAALCTTHFVIKPLKGG
jgi:uncharacterized protein (TIGR00369 family)